MANINGTWLGTYWELGMPTRFEMTIIQTGGNIMGNILDNSDLGEASVNGQIIGKTVTFRKCYLTGSRHCIDYTGVISDEENYIKGQWQGDFKYSGNWEAHRQEDNLSLDFNTFIRKKVPVAA